ncbi:hypothetical protein EA462_13985 [Natrarchaeobius halalkaliphilus]|uniref:Uncharacterized protein n=1 Tax=Natrarchaeobius halalkaliphilus TaxID=1679091 RepID=A0A3N6M0A4_9EURY|nr:hypothetical protein [Natrarchaeobius halalkaliphilus]RQG87964.1 hypothetical protein EA462_13985 [Natrarchaeobius halalkaliphilus]
MTGMKEGAGEDPFADDATTSNPDADPPSERDSSDGVTADTVEPTESTDANAGSSSPVGTSRSADQPQIRIPYKFRRDGVQDGRDRVPLFLHEETKGAERDVLRELEDRFDDDVSLTDLREALVKVGLEHLDEVELELEEWGYGMTFDN